MVLQLPPMTIFQHQTPKSENITARAPYLLFPARVPQSKPQPMSLATDSFAKPTGLPPAPWPKPSASMPVDVNMDTAHGTPPTFYSLYPICTPPTLPRLLDARAHGRPTQRQ